MPTQKGPSLGVGALLGGLWGVAAWVPGLVPQLEELAHSILVTGTLVAVLDFTIFGHCCCVGQCTMYEAAVNRQ